ncbi:MAG: TolC family protein [Candidatus Acidiferrales bacterium]
MTARFVRIVVAFYLAASLALGMPAFAQAPQQQGTQAPTQPAAISQPSSLPYTSLLGAVDYSHNKRTFPNFLSAYTQRYVPQPNLANAPGIFDLIHDGKLELTLQDAIAMALQNDLDIAVAEYTPWIDQTQLLNAEGGGTPLGQFVIGGGGGGAFDPVLFATAGVSDSVNTINNPLTSGAGTFLPSFETHSTTSSFGYSQKLHTGTSLTVSFNNDRTSSNLPENVYNPAVQSSFSVTVTQPLLSGFGLLPNMRFILEARNTDEVGKLQFKEQVINSVTQVETQYWALVADRQAVDVAKQTLAVSQKLYEDDERQLQIGTLAHLDVVTAESEIASDDQALIVAQTNQLQQEVVVLNLISKNPMDPRLQGLQILPTTGLDQVPQVPNLALPDAVNEAWANRPELQVDQFQLKNDRIEIKATRNSLLPQLSLSANYTSSGLSGVVSPAALLPYGIVPPPPNSGGVGTVYTDLFNNSFPTYSGSLQFSMPLRNRSAQAAAAEAQLADREQQTSLQRDKNNIVVGVRQALTALQQDAALVVADVKATQLAQETYDDEVKKFELGASTTYNVVLQSRDLNAAKLNELTAKTSLAIALVNFNQAMGRTLTSNNITIASNRQPVDRFTPGAPQIPGTIGERLAGNDVFGLDSNK